MNTKLSPHQKSILPILEAALRSAVDDSDHERAIIEANKIQSLFKDDRSHYRLLRAKLLCFEASLDANSLSYAEAGLLGVKRLSTCPSKIYVEASALLTVCFLRKKKNDEAKKTISEVLGKLNCIKSDLRRNQLQKRFKDRVEAECILSGLIDNKAGVLNIEAVHDRAVDLLQSGSSDTALFEFLAQATPPGGKALLRNIQDHSRVQMNTSDQKLLYPPTRDEAPSKEGKKVFSIIGRVFWKALCHPNGRIHKLWAAKMPEIYEKGYFAAAIVTALKEWQIGSSLFASGVVAIAMKQSAGEFCRLTKPKGLIIDLGDKT
jgi:hypothetical protein